MRAARSPLAPLEGRTVLVTGGAGLIGSRIVARLRELGARPLVLCALDAYPPYVYRDLFGIDTADPDVIAGDVRDEGLMARTLPDCDYVVHAAALADVAACTRKPRAAIDTNITGTQVLLDAVAATDRVRRFVYVSSASVYGDGSPEETQSPELLTVRQLLESVYGRIAPQFHERTSTVRPVSVYANTKAWGERQTALTLGAVGTSYTVVRYFSVYGEPQTIKQGSHSWVVAWFAARAALGRPLHLHGGGHQVRDLIHVDDVVEATLRAMVSPQTHTEIVNVGTGKATTVRRVAELVREHYPNAEFLETPMPPGDPLGGYASTCRMRTMLGWTPAVSLPDGVARYVAWLRKNPAAVPDWMRAEGARTVG
ncbi:NAD-dependent epimerase/dehydratase family protein [Streptomyces sp. CBMA152]|uniref:NAD-dependent epimerase/dehydratase family protein n=1 Tax=Streptomyces sp. CBMA152 TaxID=1896312 RepID=UPI002948C117|nr:NAD-dependent epimerase/dehydratase family protein [Streptomyces sp. CBMA152]MBD0746015.1 epimerase [Streptomyces sp. CBMA152]